MGKRGIFYNEQTFTAGADRAFDGIIFSLTKNILVHRIVVWFPAGNANATIYAKRQDPESTKYNQLVEEAVGLENSVSVNEPILLTPDYPRIQVYVDVVATGGKFTLNIDYEEVS